MLAVLQPTRIFDRLPHIMGSPCTILLGNHEIHTVSVRSETTEQFFNLAGQANLFCTCVEINMGCVQSNSADGDRESIATEKDCYLCTQRYRCDE